MNSAVGVDGELLVTVVDVWGLLSLAAGQPQNQQQQAQQQQLLPFASFVEHVLAFLNAFVLLHPANSVAVIATSVPTIAADGDSSGGGGGGGSSSSVFLYPPPPPAAAAALAADASAAPQSSGPIEFAGLLRRSVLEQLRRLAAATAATAEASVEEQQQQQQQQQPLHRSRTVSSRGGSPCLAGALSLALCYIHRLAKSKGPRLRPRIVVVHASPDASGQYVALMNCIFSAQKQATPVDACVVGAHDSPFLQQAAQLTAGVYARAPHADGLLQYLLSFFLADPHVRKQFTGPVLSSVDYRAACFCHKTVVDMAFVCSVCLSIYCKFQPVCQSCDAKFPLPKVPKMPKAPVKR